MNKKRTITVITFFTLLISSFILISVNSKNKSINMTHTYTTPDGYKISITNAININLHDSIIEKIDSIYVDAIKNTMNELSNNDSIMLDKEDFLSQIKNNSL